ncbi:MAG: rhamnulokinase [Calditrichales bacterium]|nr:MAG: rhamnulokinase [Calditrichales bacterium]
MKKDLPVFIVVDLGAESGRVICIAMEKGRLSLDEVARFPNKPLTESGHLHWDMPFLLDQIRTGIAKAGEKYGERLASIGVDTWGVDFGLLDADGKLLENPWHYRDHRTDGMMEKTFERVSRQKIFDSTGIQFMQLNTLFQLVAMVETGSPALQRAQTLLLMPDLVHYHLCGSRTSEFTNATTTQCFNPRKNDWNTELLALLKIPLNIFPPVVAPGTQIGTILPEVAEELGIPEIPVIAPATHDTGSAIAAVPLIDDNSVYLSSGTWSLMGIEVKQPVITTKSLLYNFTNEGGVEGTFRLLKNISGLWLLQECRRIWKEKDEGDFSYEELSALAETAIPFYAMVNTADPRFLAPEDMPLMIRKYCRETGQPVPEGIPQTVRCILESLAFEYRWVIDRLEELCGHRLERIHIIGGGSHNRLLNQLTADATGRRVRTGPFEATAIGNALVQAKSLGYITSIGEGRDLVRRSFAGESYTPSTTSEWNAMFKTYQDLRKEI